MSRERLKSFANKKKPESPSFSQTENLRSILQPVLVQLKREHLPFSEWDSECKLLNRLSYKAKNQHRSSVFFKKLCAVIRGIRNFEYIRGILDCSSFVDFMITPRTVVYDLSKLSEKKDVTLSSEFMLLGRVLGGGFLLESLINVIMECAIDIHQALLCTGYFLPWGTVTMSSLSRIFRLTRAMLCHVEKTYDLLYSVLSVECELRSDTVELPEYLANVLLSDTIETLKRHKNTFSFDSVDGMDLDGEEGEDIGVVVTRDDSTGMDFKEKDEWLSTILDSVMPWEMGSKGHE